ncbi:hypothetical protein COV18_05900 [Candidatus Woesearchaeota archaeon CG10_big_fil_rev_8_21_14_0_10_37_12]|nr:MAG: hypothetical protein COV18_05900 [Candidatus Woesearchaeota archaeon CG10_big_fil_rev_8_21_14_0_10_37_12]
MHKRAQLTIFIIIGIILLISIATVVYFTQKKATQPLEHISPVPEDVKPVYDYVTTCLNQISKDGINLLGAQGGHINIPSIIERTPTAYIANDPAEISKLPHWYYEGEDRTPTLEFMQTELSRYVRDNLPECINNFAAFQPRYSIRPITNSVPVITIADETVLVQLNWILQVDTPERTTQIETFITNHPVKLKQAWQLAKDVMETENKEDWLENLTIDFMSANTNIPISGMEFSCGRKRWLLSQVKKELQDMLYYNVPYIRLANTNLPEPIESERTYENLKKEKQKIHNDLLKGNQPDWPEDTPTDAYEINRMTWNTGTRKTDLKAAFQYQPQWTMQLNAQPNSGNQLVSGKFQGARKYLRFFCINQWHFTYDVIYPIKLAIKDETAFYGDGYLFQMSFPVIIQDNAPSRAYYGHRRFDDIITDGEFCTTFSNQRADIRVRGLEEGAIFAEELEEVNISYSCFNQYCTLGQTRADSAGIIRLQTYLPQGCGNPVIHAEKEGYIPAQIHATEENVELTLTQLKKMNYTIMVHPYNPVTNTWLDSQITTISPTRDPTRKASIAVIVNTADYEQYYEYPSPQNNTQADFVYGDARYDLDIILLKGENPIGGYHAENISITYEEVAGMNNAIFHVIEWQGALDRNFDPVNMFEFIYETGMHRGKQYAEVLKPTFTP